MKCFSCPQPFHPASGHYDARWDISICGSCHRSFLRWLRGHLAREWAGQQFYVEAATSIRPGIYPPKPFVVFQAYEVKYVPVGKLRMEPKIRLGRAERDRAL